MSDGIEIGAWRFDEELDQIAEVLYAAVHAGASVSFILPFSMDEARGFWRDKVLPGVVAGTRRVLVARAEGRVVGTVQLDLATPPNQKHRADVAKLLVLPAARRQVAYALVARAVAAGQARQEEEEPGEPGPE